VGATIGPVLVAASPTSPSRAASYT
jgi:hypothetical protein